TYVQKSEVTHKKFIARNAPYSTKASNDDNDESGDDASQKHVLDGHVCDDRVNDERQTRRKQQPQRAASREQPESVLLRVTCASKDGHEQPAQRQNRDA